MRVQVRLVLLGVLAVVYVRLVKLVRLVEVEVWVVRLLVWSRLVSVIDSLG
jgi:hypothetical protein